MLRGYHQGNCQEADSEMGEVIHTQKEIHLFLQQIFIYLSSPFLSSGDIVVNKINENLCPSKELIF